MLAILVGCGLRRAELANLPFEKIQIRQDHWVIVDLVGKGGHVRTIPIPQLAKEKLDRWTSAATISSGRVFRGIRKNGRVWGDRINVNVVWHVVNRYCHRIGLEHVAPHDLRRTCAKLPQQRRRTGTNPVLARPCLCPDHGALPGMQTESESPCERPVRDSRADRGYGLNVHWPDHASYRRTAEFRIVWNPPQVGSRHC